MTRRPQRIEYSATPFERWSNAVTFPLKRMICLNSPSHFKAGSWGLIWTFTCAGEPPGSEVAQRNPFFIMKCNIHVNCSTQCLKVIYIWQCFDFYMLFNIPTGDLMENPFKRLKNVNAVVHARRAVVRNRKQPSLLHLDFIMWPSSSVIYDALTSSKFLNLHQQVIFKPNITQTIFIFPLPHAVLVPAKPQSLFMGFIRRDLVAVCFLSTSQVQIRCHGSERQPPSCLL